MAREVLAQRRLVVDDRHAATTQHEGGANENRVADLLGHGDNLLGRVRGVVCGCRAMSGLENLAELLAVIFTAKFLTETSGAELEDMDKVVTQK